MKSRTCTGCGWVFPSSNHDTKCKFCKALFKEQYCNTCKGFKPTEEFGVHNGRRKSICKSCSFKPLHALDTKEWNLERNRKFMSIRLKEAEAKLDALHKAAKQPFKILSEQQWLEACSYFNGCAICGHEHIETRQFILNPKHGGKYSVWNVVPMCGKCATYTVRVKNPFVWLDHHLGYAKTLGLNDERRQKLYDFIIQQIDRAGGNNEQS